MIDIQQSEKWNWNYEHTQTGLYTPCIVCGKAVKNPKHYVRLFWGATAVTELEAQEIIEREGDGGDLMYYPVGNDCYRKNPDLHPYVKDARLANERFKP